ncbi:MAG: hypothetical protein KKF56_01850, partial [Nanoarchaeota archaeon]|nr:hypothetical protein [Nanoarchaeota archaeon]
SSTGSGTSSTSSSGSGTSSTSSTGSGTSSTSSSGSGTTCSDGTLKNTCSTNKPYYCSTNLTFTRNCRSCGCTDITTCNLTTGACIQTTLTSICTDTDLINNISILGSCDNSTAYADMCDLNDDLVQYDCSANNCVPLTPATCPVNQTCSAGRCIPG